MNERLEEIASIVVDTALGIHVDVGPGLMESVYEAILEKRLRGRGMKVDRQKPIKLEIDNLVFPEAFEPICLWKIGYWLN